MSNIDEDAAFDCVAMVEESEKLMRNMYASLPRQLCAAVEAAIGRTGKIEALEQANRSALQAANRFSATVKKASKITVALALLIPAVITILFYAHLRSLTNDKGALERRIAGLTAMAESLKTNNPDGIELESYGNGEKGVILPKGYEYSYSGRSADGRAAIVLAPSE